MRITAPGSSMPVIHSPLESPNGQTYYSLYPLRPGKTTIDVLQILPYENRNYTYIKKFYHPVSSFEIGVIPVDMKLSGTGLSKIRTDPENNIAVYRSAPVEAGAEVEWVFSGGTPVAEQEASSATVGSNIQSDPNDVGRNTDVIVYLLLMGFVLILWYAFNHTSNNLSKSKDSQKLEQMGASEHPDESIEKDIASIKKLDQSSGSVHQENEVRCPFCGGDIIPGKNFCVDCGHEQ